MEALIKPETGLIFWTVLIFVLLVFLLSKTVWKPLLEAINAREEKIRNDLENARRARDEAEAAKKEIEKRLNELSAEISLKLEKSQREAAIERDRILEKASQQASLLLEDARKEIEKQKVQAEIQLEKKVADIALLVSQRVLGSVVDKSIDARLSQHVAREIATLNAKKIDK